MKSTKKINYFILATALLAVDTAQAETSFHDALVVQSTPVYRVIETQIPVNQRYEEEVVRSTSRHHYRSRTPGLLGAVIGGAIGNSVGHHNTSRKVGTVVGAILGGAIARDIQEADRYDHYDNVRLETVERCETVTAYEQGEKLVGYDVLYRYNGVDHTVRTPRDPGATIRVRVDVEPVI